MAVHNLRQVYRQVPATVAVHLNAQPDILQYPGLHGLVAAYAPVFVLGKEEELADGQLWPFGALKPPERQPAQDNKVKYRDRSLLEPGAG